MTRDRAFSEDSFVSTTTNTAAASSVSAPPALRRLALFVDGMARAMILPFGPLLVYRLVYRLKDESDLTAWAGVPYYFAVVVIVYILGRSLGSGLAHRLGKPSSDRLPVYVARIGGAALSLHIFTYGAGLQSVVWLGWIRLLSAFLSGVLYAWTDHLSLPEDTWVFRRSSAPWDNEDEVVTRRKENYIDIASGTAKLYMTGFCISILTGGMLFRKATKDHTFQALTGADQYTWSPLFLVGVAVVTEIVLRFLFSWISQQPASSRKKAPRKGSKVYSTTGTPLGPSIYEEDGYDDDMSEINENDFLDPLTSTRKMSDGTLTFRNRHGSNTGSEDFFDCHSNFSDEEDVWEREDVKESQNEDEVCIYQNYRCVYPDGTPSFCNPGNSKREVPANFLKFYSQNTDRAYKAWQATQQWRRDDSLWKIHASKHGWFEKIKEAYPHFVHGHTKAGYPIVYEQPGRMRLKELFRSGCKIEDMLFHYKFFMEYLSNHVCLNDKCRRLLCPNGERFETSKFGFMVVMDVKGAGLSHLSGEVVMYLKQAGDINSAHYPLSIKRAFLVNSPFWLSGKINC